MQGAIVIIFLHCFQIKDGSASDLVEISEDESFLRFMQECGQTRKLHVCAMMAFLQKGTYMLVNI